MLHLELLRHGETELGGGLRGSLDDALTEQGWAQLRAAVQGAGPWDRLISSPLQRCARFAEEVALANALPLHFEADLQELHFGDWEGRTAAQLMDSDAEALGRSGPIPMRSRRLMASRCCSSRRVCWLPCGACSSATRESGCC